MLERCSPFIGVEPEEIAHMSDLGKLESFRDGDTASFASASQAMPCTS